MLGLVWMHCRPCYNACARGRPGAPPASCMQFGCLARAAIAAGPNWLGGDVAYSRSETGRAWRSWAWAEKRR